MGLLFRNWLEEGYYEEDSWGDLTRIEDSADILRAQKEGKLYQNDGMATTKVGEDEKLDLSHGKYKD
jgi:hypothetical protein